LHACIKIKFNDKILQTKAILADLNFSNYNSENILLNYIYIAISNTVDWTNFYKQEIASIIILLVINL